MSIRTITETEASNLTIRDDVPGVMEGYVGPKRQSCPDCWLGVQEGDSCPTCDVESQDTCTTCDGTGGPFLLPLARPEVQAHLVGWLGRGERGCDACRGAAWQGDCSWCREPAGYLRPPADLYHLLKPQALGGLPDWIRLALIWGSVVRVAAGMGPLSQKPVEALGFTNTRYAFFHWAGEDCHWADTAEGDNDYGWKYGKTHGPERGAAATERLHQLALTRGHALTDKTPTGRVIRFEVPDATP